MRRGCDAWRHRPIEHIRRLCRGRRPGHRTKRRGLVGCACRRRRPAPRRGWEVDRACHLRSRWWWPSSRDTGWKMRRKACKLRHLVLYGVRKLSCIDFLLHHDDKLKTGLKKIGQTQQKSGGERGIDAIERTQATPHLPMWR